MKKSIILILLVLLATSVFASTVTKTYSFDKPQVKYSGEYATIVQENTFINGVPGQPAITYSPVSLYIGSGKEAVNVQVKRSGQSTIKLTNRLIPAQQQFPLSKMDESYFTEPNQEYYSLDKSFPGNEVKNLRTDFIAGHSIATFAVNAVEYNPANNTITWYDEITISVNTEYTQRASESQDLYKENKNIYNRIVRSVDNPEAVNFSYNTRNNGIDYLIIYPQDYLAQIEDIKHYHEARNLNVELLSVESIQANNVPNNADFDDLQDKIREYIKYYYSQDVNDLSYVLLAGDDDVIPHRGFWADNDAQADFDIPADCYYSNLDGSFDYDGNDVFGEEMDADLYPELAIGRICYNNVNELDNILNKIYKFTEEPVVDQVTTSFMCGEWLWEGPTYGGDYMDELIGNTNMYGYSTTGYPENWTFPKLYDRDNGGDGSWNGNDLFPYLNQGPTYINHLGHSNTTYNMRISNDYVTTSNITNNGITSNFSVDFSQGCYAGAFDNRGTEVGQYIEDCISEKFTALDNSAVAMISNSRYGWGSQGSTNGASQYFHREWVDAIFTEGIYSIGESLNDAKVDNIPRMDSPTMFWCYYQTTLFGDPAMLLWTDTPGMIEENISTVWTMGQSSYPLDITTDDVKVSLMDGDDILWSGEKDFLGNIAVITSQTLLAGEYQLFITAPNSLPRTIDIEIIESDQAFVGTVNVTTNMESEVFSVNNTLGFDFSVKNFGSDELNEDVYLKLFCENSNIEVIEDSLYIGTMTGNQVIDFEDIFEIKNLGGHDDGETATVRIISYFGDNQSVNEKYVTLNASNLVVDNLSLVTETVSAETGMDIPMNLTITNNGSGYSDNVSLMFFSTMGEITFSHLSYNISNLAPGESVELNDIFTINIAETVQDGAMGNVQVLVLDPHYNTTSVNHDFIIGVDQFTFESGLMGFSIVDPTPSSNNQWAVSTNRNHTENGTSSIKFGGEGDSDYANSSYGYLETPSFNVEPGSVLKFYHWMKAERDIQNQNYAWDGGYVEMSVNNGQFMLITPLGDYPYSLRDNDANPIPAYTPVYSGSFSWTLAEFPIGNMTGTVKFRFIFAADGYTTDEGWYIDDLVVDLPTANTDSEVLPVVAEIKGNYPNPFNPETTIEYSVPSINSKSAEKVSLEIYNIKGQKVTTLVNDMKAPGTYRAVWNGLNSNNQRVASGIYFTKLKVASKTDTKKMILMK